MFITYFDGMLITSYDQILTAEEAMDKIVWDFLKKIDPLRPKAVNKKRLGVKKEEKAANKSTWEALEELETKQKKVK